MIKRWYLVVGIWLLLLLYLFQQAWFSTTDANILASRMGSSSDSKRLHNLDADFDPTRLIFLISMGEEAKESKMVERFVWSARHRGQWNGYILLLTDAPIERYAGFSERFLVMNPEPQHFDTRFKEDMPYKRFKTSLLDYLDLDYLD